MRIRTVITEEYVLKISRSTSTSAAAHQTLPSDTVKVMCSDITSARAILF